MGTAKSTNTNNKVITNNKVDNTIKKTKFTLENKVVNILGTDYKLKFKTPQEVDENHRDGYAGYCDRYNKEIVVIVSDIIKSAFETKGALDSYYKETLRHEILHAFFDESGLCESAHPSIDSWALNEEMVDWFAIQSPKIFSIYKSLYLI